MKTWTWQQHSALGEPERNGWQLRPRLCGAVVVAIIGLNGSLPASLCFGSATKTVIPFQLYNENLVIVKATIGTRKNVNMIIDTGTNPSAISKELADRLELRGNAESLQTLNGTIQTESLILQCIQIGPLARNSVKVVVQDLRFIEQRLGIPLGGIAGLDILGTMSFTIDYRRREIVFGPVAKDEKVILFETQKPFLTINVRVEGQTVRLLLDSGTGGLLVYRNRFQTTQGQIRLDQNTSIVAAGGMTSVRWHHADVSLGTHDLGVRNIAIADLDSDAQSEFDGLFGFAKMGFRKVSFDFENGLFGWD